MGKKANSWIKKGAQVVSVKWDPYRYNSLEAAQSSIKEETITKVGTRFFYTGEYTSFDKVTCLSTGYSFTHRRVFESREHILEFFDTQKKITMIKEGIDRITPEQAKLIHAIMFPHEPALWGTEEIEDSIESIEWYGVASAMFPGSKFDKVNGPQVDKAKQELKEVTAQFLSIVAQGILAKHASQQSKACPRCGSTEDVKSGAFSGEYVCSKIQM